MNLHPPCEHRPERLRVPERHRVVHHDRLVALEDRAGPGHRIEVPPDGVNRQRALLGQRPAESGAMDGKGLCPRRNVRVARHDQMEPLGAGHSGDAAHDLGGVALCARRLLREPLSVDVSSCGALSRFHRPTPEPPPTSSKLSDAPEEDSAGSTRHPSPRVASIAAGIDQAIQSKMSIDHGRSVMPRQNTGTRMQATTAPYPARISGRAGHDPGPAKQQADNARAEQVSAATRCAPVDRTEVDQPALRTCCQPRAPHRAATNWWSSACAMPTATGMPGPCKSAGQP